MSSLVTIILFVIARKLHRVKPIIFFVPVFFSVVGCALYVYFADIHYDQYLVENELLTFILGPAVVALGVLLHKHIQTIKSNLIPLLLTIFMGSLLSVSLVALTATVLHFPTELTASLLPIGITTPIAIEVAAPLGGDPSITSVMVIMIGLLGNIMSPWWIKWFGIHKAAAAGIAIGTVSHGIGTARALQMGETQGLYSGLAMCINGVITVFTAPMIWALIH
ncbi:MAG TPA: LrgB family protein [Membranihabitans sp.]|nr:LrgB family protein [Membranihabitans sp.]